MSPLKLEPKPWIHESAAVVVASRRPEHRAGDVNICHVVTGGERVIFLSAVTLGVSEEEGGG